MAESASQPKKDSESKIIRSVAKPAPETQKVAPLPPREDPTMAVRRRRRARAVGLALKFSLSVLGPTALSGVYYASVASDIYESTTLFTIQSASGAAAIGLGSILGIMPGSSPGARDAMVVREYILSRDMLALLKADHQFLAHYQDPSFDWYARLADDSSAEDAYEYYLEQIKVDHDSSSGVLTLNVHAFTENQAHDLSEAILHYSEEMVNQLSERARSDQTSFAKAELSLAEGRLSQARQGVLALQAERSEFNPQQTASEALTVRGQLQGELAKVNAELSQARAFMSASAPKVVALQQRANALARQVAKESRRLVGPGTEGGINTSIASFESAILEKEFAQLAYRSALTSLELARTDAGRQHRYLARITEPSSPDEATYPKRILGVLTAFLLSVALAGIVSLFGAAVKEHAKL